MGPVHQGRHARCRRRSAAGHPPLGPAGAGHAGAPAAGRARTLERDAPADRRGDAGRLPALGSAEPALQHHLGVTLTVSSLEQTAGEQPDKVAAVIADSGDSLTYAALHARSARWAAQLASRLEEGETIAVLLANRLEYFEVCFAARRAGLYYVPVSTHLTAGELAYMLQDSGAKLLFTEDRFIALADALPPEVRGGLDVVSVDGAAYRAIAETGDVPPLPKRALGLDFAYSSGTTGRPKGVRHKLAGDKQLEDAV
ncbi:MAG: hypothetical protein EOO24_36645, partial [Comamonadaceae bacterium]